METIAVPHSLVDRPDARALEVPRGEIRIEHLTFTYGRRDGKRVSAQLQGDGWLCIAPGTVQRLKLSGTMYGGYTTDADSVLEFRLLEWRKAFSINPPNRGFFEVAGRWRGAELVMDRPNEQGVRFNTGPFIDSAVVTLRWASYEEFQSICGASR